MAIVTAGAAVAGAGSSIIGGIMGQSAAKKAAAQQQQQIQSAIDFQRQIYGTAQQNLNPFIGAGTSALGALTQLYGLAPPGSGGGGNALSAYNAFTQTPFYQFPFSQGLAALNASGAARGLTLSGGQAKALQAYGQGYAGQNFGSYISALANLANLGKDSASALAGYGNQASGTNLTGSTAAGNAAASGTIGGQNQFNNVLGAIPQLLGSLGNLGNNTGSSYGGGGLFSNQTVGNYSIPGTSLLGQYGPLFGSPAAGTSGGFNNGADLLGAGGDVIVPPIPA